jgi:hypothetical protein
MPDGVVSSKFICQYFGYVHKQNIECQNIESPLQIISAPSRSDFRFPANQFADFTRQDAVKAVSLKGCAKSARIHPRRAAFAQQHWQFYQ